MRSDATDCSPENLIDALHDRLTRMAGHYARCSRLDRDDLLQEAWLALLEAARVFDPALGELTPYLLQRARWRMLDAVKYTRLRSAASRPEPADDAGVAVLPDDSAECQEFAARLSPMQQQILSCLMHGFTWRDTGEMLGFTSANVAYHVREIRRRYMRWKKSHDECCGFSTADSEIDLQMKG